MTLREATESLRKSLRQNQTVVQVTALGTKRILVAVREKDESIPSTFEEYEVHQYKVPLPL